MLAKPHSQRNDLMERLRSQLIELQYLVGFSQMCMPLPDSMLVPPTIDRLVLFATGNVETRGVAANPTHMLHRLWLVDYLS